MRQSNQYVFLKTGEDLTEEVAEQVQKFQEYAVRSGLTSVWNRNRAFYENRIFGNSIAKDIIDAGDVGELKACTFNHFRNILRHMLNKITATMPDFQCTPINTDKDSRRSARIGEDIVHYYYKVKRLGAVFNAQAEKALVYGDGYLCCEWNPTHGKIIRNDLNGRYIREGDFDFEDLSVFDVYFDYNKKSKKNWDWVTFRRRRNKFEMAALFPNLADKIIELDEGIRKDLYLDFLRESDYERVGDDIYVYSSYHRAGNILEKGKYLLWAGDRENAIPLYEGDNPYGEALPIFGLSPASYMETSFGFTEANILRAAQMVSTIAVSAMVSNLNSAQANNFWSRTGSGITVEKLTDGMNLIQSDEKPEVLSFYQENPNLVNMLNLCISTMETLSGQNAVVRGNVADTPNLKSGVALATVINQAQQYGAALESNFYDNFEDVTSFLIETLKKTANEERMYDIAGLSSRSAVKSFTKADLLGVSRSIVNRTNPIAKSPAGQIEIATNLLQQGTITPLQYFDVINTGSYRSVTETPERMLDYIAAVKEKLLDGQQVIPIPGVDHQLFIKEINSLLMDIDMTSDPKNAPIIKNITALINGHMQILRNGDELAALIYGGKLPTPPAVANEEIQGQPPPPMQQGMPPRPMMGPQNRPALPVGPTENVQPPGGLPPTRPAAPLA